MAAHRLKVDGRGRVTLPAACRRHLGVAPGDGLILHLDEDGLRLTTPELALRRARRILDKYITSDESLTDSLIADRCAEAARE